MRTIVGLGLGWIGARLLAVLSQLHVVPTPAAKRTSRRGFVRNAALGTIGVVLAEIAGGVVWLLWPNKTGAFGGDITVAAADVPPVNGKPAVNTPGKVHLVRNDDGVLALSWKCVHLGCTVPWNEGEQRFHGPCHGSISLYNGVRVAGPAPRPMDLMRVTVLPTGDVTVNTGKLSTRTGYKPEQAVPYPT